MKLLISVIVLFTVPTWASDMAHYNGYKKVNDRIFENILKPYEYMDPNGFLTQFDQIGLLIGERLSTFGGSPLLELTGFYPQGVNNGEMRNGEPNSMSLMVYYFLFHKISEKIQDDCKVTDDPVISNHYQPEFLSLMDTMCSLTSANDMTEDMYFDFWTSIHSFNAPFKEYESWLNYHDSQNYNDVTEQVYAMAVSALMNPYLLIQN